MRQIFIFLTIILVYFLANYYVFRHLGVLFKDSYPLIKILFILTAIFLSFSAVLFFLLSRADKWITLTSILYKVGTGWMIITLYFFLFFLFLDVVRALNNTVSLVADENLYNKYSVGFVILLIASLCTYGYTNYLNKQKISLDLKFNKKLKNNVKILAISDLHLGYAIRNKELNNWINLINKENPDIVLIAGDIVDSSTYPLEQYKLDTYFKKIKAPLGVYTCLGNHEYISGIDKSLLFFKKAGIRVLRDSVELVDNNFYLLGRDDRTNPNRKSLSQLIEGLDPSKPLLVLNHQPYNLEEVEENNIDFQLSGHTHRGQVFPLSLLADAIYEKAHGYIKKGNSHIYVSSGIGIWGGRYRIGTQSEYIVLTLSN